MKNTEYYTRTFCRVCGSYDLREVLSLGDQAIAEWSTKAKKATRIPLDVVRCPDCDLLQLRHTTNPRLLWNENYGYRSGINETMRNHLQGIADAVTYEADLQAGDIAIDIGCNDGTLLKNYPMGVYRVGFEPSRNVGVYAHRDHAVDKLYMDFFSANQYVRDYGEHSAKAITAISMFYDLDDPNVFVHNIKRCLEPDGVFVVQQNYVGGMLAQNAVDNICHEHLEYYSLYSLQNLLKRHEMEVYRVEQNDLNGGSFRTFICNNGARPVERSVSELERREDIEGLTTNQPYQEFGDRARANGHELKDYVEDQLNQGKKIYVYGASTRGNTLLQYAGLDKTQIIAAAERNPDKVGKVMPGTEIPIVSEKEARAANPDFFLVLPWFFREEFVQREREFMAKGGRLIFPLPRLEIVP